MKAVGRFFFWKILALAVHPRCHELLATFYGRVVEELRPDGTVRHVQGPASGGLPTILVLSYEQFRGDVEVLAASGEVRVLRLAECWLTRLMFQFYPLEVGQKGYRPFFNPTPEEITWQARADYRAFLRRFLPLFFDKIGVDVVPACVEGCPSGARIFGDLDDPDSEVSKWQASRDAFTLREDLSTEPKVIYLPQ